MPLTYANGTMHYVGKGLKLGYIDVTFDASYALGGETFDLSVGGAFGAGEGFAAVYGVFVEQVSDSAGDELAITIATNVFYNYAAARAVATGTLQAMRFSVADATGVYGEVPATTDLSTAVCRVVVLGS